MYASICESVGLKMISCKILEQTYTCKDNDECKGENFRFFTLNMFTKKHRLRPIFRSRQTGSSSGSFSYARNQLTNTFHKRRKTFHGRIKNSNNNLTMVRDMTSRLQLRHHMIQRQIVITSMNRNGHLTPVIHPISKYSTPATTVD